MPVPTPPGKIEAGLRLEDALGDIPEGLRKELLVCFNAVIKNFREGHWETTVLNAGKLCEVVYTIIVGRAQGKYPDHASKPQNMVDACRNLERDASNLPRALRIQIPRSLVPLYEIRNNRGVGHVGGDVDPNHMDAVYAVAACKWIVADLVRVFHRSRPEAAACVVESLVEREVPLIWEVAGVKRILDGDMRTTDRVLLLLYGTPEEVAEDELRRWAEYENVSRFRSQILRTLHAMALIHYDESRRIVTLSPKGAQRAEEVLLSKGRVGEATTQ